jgi:hypothetical protein
MKEILLGESVHLDKENGIHLVTYSSDQPNIQSYVLELLNRDLFAFK